MFFKEWPKSGRIRLPKYYCSPKKVFRLCATEWKAGNVGNVKQAKHRDQEMIIVNKGCRNRKHKV